MKGGHRMLVPAQQQSILKDIGFSESQINEFTQLSAQQQRHFLANERQQILIRLHTTQKQLDCLDYLRYHQSQIWKDCFPCQH